MRIDLSQSRVHNILIEKNIMYIGKAPDCEIFSRQTLVYNIQLRILCHMVRLSFYLFNKILLMVSPRFDPTTFTSLDLHLNHQTIDTHSNRKLSNYIEILTIGILEIISSSNEKKVSISLCLISLSKEVAILV